MYFEFKRTKLSVERLSAPNSLFELNTTTFGDTVNDASFVSIAYPVTRSIVVSVARYQFLDDQETFNSSYDDETRGIILRPLGLSRSNVRVQNGVP